MTASTSDTTPAYAMTAPDLREPTDDGTACKDGKGMNPDHV